VTVSRFSPKGSPIASLVEEAEVEGEPQRVVHLWDPATGRLIHRLAPRPEGLIVDVNFSPSGRLLVTSGNGVVIWDVEQGHPVRVVDWGKEFATARFVDEEHLLAHGDETVLVRWKDGEVVRRFGPASDEVAVSADGAVIAVVQGNQQITLWDSRSGERLGEVARPMRPGVLHQAHFSKVDLSPRGDLLLAAGYVLLPEIWTLSPLRMSRTLPAPPSTSDDMYFVSGTFSPSGRFVATTAERGTSVLLVEARTGRTVARFSWRGAAMNEAISFSPDETLLATTHDDGSTRIWCIRTRGEVFRRYALPAGK
jgi:WD40 repeat protein